jgi:hypothetical protein
MKWEPIETAPKDGRLVLLANENVTEIGWWSDGFSGRWEKRRMKWLPPSEGGWAVWFTPTHWLPLPQLPDSDNA